MPGIGMERTGQVINSLLWLIVEKYEFYLSSRIKHLQGFQNLGGVLFTKSRGGYSVLLFRNKYLIKQLFTKLESN